MAIITRCITSTDDGSKVYEYQHGPGLKAVQIEQVVFQALLDNAQEIQTLTCSGELFTVTAHMITLRA